MMKKLLIILKPTFYTSDKSILCYSIPAIAHVRGNSQQWPASSELAVYKTKSLDYLKAKTTDVVTWYEQFTGLNEVKQAQHRVLEATELLKEAQERRREARLPLAEVQKKLQDFLPELRDTPRDDDRYIQLVKQEHKYLKEIKYLQERLVEAEKDEREYFEMLSTSLRSSHEAERTQTERTKYWSIIASLIGTSIGVIGTSLNNNRKMKKLQNLVFENNQPEMIASILQNQLDDFAAKNSVKGDLDRIETLLRQQIERTDPQTVPSSVEQVAEKFGPSVPQTVHVFEDQAQTKYIDYCLYAFGAWCLARFVFS